MILFQIKTKGARQLGSTPGFLSDCLAFGIAVLLVLPLVFIGDIPLRDVATRYAPMADAFAAGNWPYAFHPRTPLLLPSLGGIFAWLFHCSGFTAVKMVSMLGFAAGVFPLAALLRRLYSSAVAHWGVGLYLLMVPLLRYAGSGLRETLKTLLILWMAAAMVRVFEKRRDWVGFSGLGVAAGLGVLTRGDLVLLAGGALFAAMILETDREYFPWRSAGASLLAGMITLPAIWLNWRFAATSVPEFRFDAPLRMLFGHSPTPRETCGLMFAGIILLALCARGCHQLYRYPRLLSGSVGVATLAILTLTGAIMLRPEFVISQEMLVDFLCAAGKGMYLPYAVPAIVGLWLRFHRKEWKPAETILLFLILVNFFGTVLQIIWVDHYLFVSARYLLPAAPLELGWCAVSLILAWRQVSSRWRWLNSRWITGGILLGFAVGSWGYAGKDLWNSLLPQQRKWEQRQLIKNVAASIRGDWRGTPETNDDFQLDKYHAPGSPRIAYWRLIGSQLSPSDDAVLISAYLAGGSVNQKYYDYTVTVMISNRIDADLPGDLLAEFRYRGNRYEVRRVQ